ncbi:ABC transporter substrate-binding protein [Cohnella fermenti]|uniref:ABC transporter substrate-binding protein n=1 Tax=Cohnella fermenti TaxID=2565925 RepID=A0A4S4BJD5_9BACL|nr:ABC transporter substrate-binding protein [Cohnella fermenti]THF73784.1 ABC transporter substrate-binding protein [Cohnella fermenti]
MHRKLFTSRRSAVLSVCALSSVLLLGGCGSNSDSGSSGSSASPAASPSASSASSATASPSASVESREYTHLMGTITLEGKPERIVAPYLEDALVTLGITPAAKWAYGDLVQEYLEPYIKDVPKLDFTDGLNKEALVGTDPDLIVLYTPDLAAEGAYDQFSQIAPTYVFQDATVSWKDTLNVIGDMTGTSDKADAAIAEYDSKVADAKEKLQPYVEGKTFAVIRAKPKEIQLMDGTYYSGPVLYADLGLTPHKLVKEWSWDYAQALSLEKLPELDADYLFILVQGEQSRPLLEEFQSSALWQSLPAVKAGHAYEMPSNYWMASGAIANSLKIDDVVRTLVP